jgi:hypothetical protein
MEAERPEKNAIRDLWAGSVKQYTQRFPGDEDLLYLTLSGAEGRDIQLLAKLGIIELTEVGSISPPYQSRIAAVESNLQAVRKLQGHFPGLKIYEHPIKDLLRGDTLIRFPEKDDQKLCRARVVNLDLNSPLEEIGINGEHVFPILMWIKKLGQLHAQHPRREWCLLLTLYGEITWAKESGAAVQKFLAENFNFSGDFGTSSKALLGRKLYSAIVEDASLHFGSLGRTEQQKVLMIAVPKKIVDLVRDQGWNITTSKNLRYGRRGHAPMVTWVFNFDWRHAGDYTPNQLYAENLKNILISAGHINENGKIIPDV